MATPRSYDAFVADIPDPARRAKALLCLILLEILHRLVAGLNGAPCPVASTLHARLRAGQDFGLSPQQLADLRLIISGLDAFLLPTDRMPPDFMPANLMPANRPSADRALTYPMPATRTLTRQLPRASPRRHFPRSRPPPEIPGLPRQFRAPNSFRYRNKIGTYRAVSPISPPCATVPSLSASPIRVG